jgi:adenylate cyclase
MRCSLLRLLPCPPAKPGTGLPAAALSQSGRQEEAAAELRDFMTEAPDVFRVMVRNRPPYMSPEDQAHLLEGIRKAGWNE